MSNQCVQIAQVGMFIQFEIVFSRVILPASSVQNTGRADRRSLPAGRLITGYLCELELNLLIMG